MKFSIGYGTGFRIGEWRLDMERRLIKAGARATDTAARGARDDQRTVFRGARLGGLANAIGYTSDLKKNRIRGAAGGHWSVSGDVYARIRSDRTAGAIEAYTEGATIVAKKRWLAIATDQIPRLAGRYRMTPELYKAKGYESRIGKLEFRPTSKPGLAYLVAKHVGANPIKRRSARRLLKSGAPGKGRVDVGIIAFILIKTTRRQKRVNIDYIMRKWQSRLPRLIADIYNRG